MKEKYTRELEEYRSFSEEIKDTLEANYQLAMYNKEFEKAYEAIGSLMAFKLIDADDIRIEKNNKTYVPAGIDKEHRFRLDYRRDINYIPDWIYGKVEPGRTFSLKSIEHMGKRVEGNYSGDTVFGSHQVSIRIQSANSSKQVDNVIEDTHNIFKVINAPKNLDDIREMARNGVYRLFTITIDGSCISRYKTIGTIIMRMTENGIQCLTTINYDSIMNNWIDIDETLSLIKSTIEKMANQEVRIKLTIDKKKSVDIQRGFVNSKRVVAG